VAKGRESLRKERPAGKSCRCEAFRGINTRFPAAEESGRSRQRDTWVMSPRMVRRQRSSRASTPRRTLSLADCGNRTHGSWTRLCKSHRSSGADIFPSPLAGTGSFRMERFRWSNTIEKRFARGSYFKGYDAHARLYSSAGDAGKSATGAPRHGSNSRFPKMESGCGFTEAVRGGPVAITW